MPEEIQNQSEQKNTVATVGMWFSIIGLIALITLFFAWLGLPMLFVGLVLGIVGLFYKPRGRARVAICIPLVVYIVIAAIVCYIWSSVKTPATQFGDWAKVELENIDEETLDEDRFNLIVNEEFNKMMSSIDEDEFEMIMKNGTGSNAIEKGSYFFFSLLQQGLENSIERYNNELPEIDEDVEVIDDEDDIDDVDTDDEDDVDSAEEVTIDQDDEEDRETFSQSERNDIEEVLDILE